MSESRLHLRWQRRRKAKRLSYFKHACPSRIGRLARTTTPLRTSGFVEIDGHELEVFSVRGYIPAGKMVKIVGKINSWYTVEPLTFGSTTSAT